MRRYPVSAFYGMCLALAAGTTATASLAASSSEDPSQNIPQKNGYVAATDSGEITYSGRDGVARHGGDSATKLQLSGRAVQLRLTPDPVTFDFASFKERYLASLISQTSYAEKYREPTPEEAKALRARLEVYAERAAREQERLDAIDRKDAKTEAPKTVSFRLPGAGTVLHWGNGTLDSDGNIRDGNGLILVRITQDGKMIWANGGGQLSEESATGWLKVLQAGEVRKHTGTFVVRPVDDSEEAAPRELTQEERAKIAENDALQRRCGHKQTAHDEEYAAALGMSLCQYHEATHVVSHPDTCKADPNAAGCK